MRVTKKYAALEKIEVSMTGACIAALLMREGTVPDGFSMTEAEFDEDGSVTLYFSKEAAVAAPTVNGDA